MQTIIFFIRIVNIFKYIKNRMIYIPINFHKFEVNCYELPFCYSAVLCSVIVSILISEEYDNVPDYMSITEVIREQSVELISAHQNVVVESGSDADDPRNTSITPEQHLVTDFRIDAPEIKPSDYPSLESHMQHLVTDFRIDAPEIRPSDYPSLESHMTNSIEQNGFLEVMLSHIEHPTLFYIHVTNAWPSVNRHQCGFEPSPTKHH